LRSHQTTEYMRQRYKSKKEALDNRSCLSKCGSLVKTLFVYSVAASVLIPSLYEFYNRAMDNGNSVLDAQYDTVNLRDDPSENLTPQEIAKRV